MTTPILVTKLFIPATRPELVPRPRLIARLNSGLHRKLTLVSAPAGFGKTTLVTDWLQAAAKPDEAIPNQQPSGNHNNQTGPQQLPNVNQIAWFSLDEEDNDPTRFITYLVSALNRSVANGAPFGNGMLETLQSSQPTVSQKILTTLINEIATIDSKIILVLDDYHLIDAEPIHGVLEFLLENLPPQLHLVIATREDPPLSLSRLRVRDHMTELRAADLRFSSSEAAVFLNEAMGLNLTSAEIAALEERTEGWIAGLQLAALSLQGRTDKTQLIKSFTGSNRLVLDYLIEEVLNQQPEAIQHFLLQTAVLDRLTGSLCDALTGQDNGQETLELLEQANLFIIPLDAERRWYRYHHLLADLLRQRLRQTRLDQIPKLHNQASEWYEQNRFIDEAIEYALRAKAFTRAANLIEKVAKAAWGGGEDTKLRRWLDGLPTETLAANLQLCIFYAWTLLATGQQEMAEQNLIVVEQSLNSSTLLTDQNSEKMKLQGRMAATRAFMAFYQGNVPEMIQFSHQALACLPKQDYSWRSTASNTLGDAYDFQGKVGEAYKFRLEAVEASKAAGNCYQIIIANLKLALNLRTRGQLQQVVEICQEQMQLANECGVCPPMLVGWLLAIWGEALAEMNDLAGAIRQAQKGTKLTKHGGDLAMLGWSHLCLIRVLFSQGDFVGAEAVVQEMEHIDRENDMPPWITSLVTAWQVRLCLAQDKLETAVRCAAEHGIDVAKDPSSMSEMECIALVRILIAQEQLDDATVLLSRLLKAAKAGGRIARVIEILILQALACQAKDDITRAMSALEEALALAKSGGFVRIFVDEGVPMVSLLNKALSQGIASDYVRFLLGVFTSTDTKPYSPAKTQPITLVYDASLKNPELQLVEALSEREIEVLQLIAEGRTNLEIADRLYLSLNTVKVHTRNIYSKLDVHSRTQAVSKAKDLRFLPPA